ncbi:MAG: FtsW/RodA/SpoVE family cell cycle protein [Clostridiales bacterium]|nr:FtsW/RodA/SpoVE family cell cycle protein [Candidatus Equinaster intestinalis]
MKIFARIADYIRECDKILFILCLFTSLFGCAAVLSATNYTGSYSQFFTQLGALLIGVAAIIVISLFDFSVYLKFWPIAALAGIVPVILTFFIGYAPPGTDDKAWLLIGPVSFQPAELLKIMFLITFSAHLEAIQDNINNLKYLLPACVHGFLPTVIIHFQGDDGTALVFAIMALGMLCAAGVKLKYFLIFFGSAAVASPFVYFFVMNDDQRERILNILSSEVDIQNGGYQQYRGSLALSGGGWFGQGYLNGDLTQTNGVPEMHNDFIFVSIGEELGFIGLLAVMLLLAAICIRILLIGKGCYRKSGTYICVGMFTMLLAHIIINVGMCLSILPVIGITLPFFSAGGTSLVCLLLGIGLVMSVYMHRFSRISHLRDS